MSTAAPVQKQAAKSPSLSHSTHVGLLLQRKCTCGGSAGLTGECEDCLTDKLLGANGARLQRKLTIGASNDSLEQEADRVADQVVAKRKVSSSVSPLAVGRLQREDAPKVKTNEEKYKEGFEKLGEAFLKTPLGKEILEKIKQDTLVKGATEFGIDFISTWPGKIITGAAATGAVAALAATHKELPAQIPEIPLNVLTPGLSVQLTYKGPVDKPTEAMITFKFTEQAPKNSTDKKPMSEADKFRAETARLAAEDAKFRAGMTYMPGSPEDLQQKAELEAVRKAALKYSGGLDIDATIKKYPWLATPQPKSGLQLTMPKPSFGIQPPSLLGDEFKLKSPVEQKKKQDEPLMQRKLAIGASNDPLEQETDRVADQVLAAPANPAVSGALPHIQRFTGQPSASTGSVPASVDRVLASPGRTLGPGLRQEMEQRFGHDFSRVRVHSDAAAEQSALDVNAHAYTAGHNIVFGAGRFAPGTNEGQRLIAHELTHVVQQGAAPVAATRSPAQAVGEGATEAKDLRTSSVSESGRLQRQPKGGKRAPQTEACPPMERNEKGEAAKAQLQMVETIPQQEWLIYGFPIGGTEISFADAGRFISAIVRSLNQGHLIYVTGQDPLEVLGFSDCFAGPQVDNYAIRQLRAANFCAGARDKYAATPKSASNLIRACGPAPMNQYVGPNATKADRAQNRSVLVRRVAKTPVQFQEGNETFPYNPKYGPGAEHCAAYKTPQARDILGRVYMNNAHCSCMVTPDEPHNNCVRDCLQQKMWNLLANQIRDRKPGDPPMDINQACLLIWKHHRECYHDCGCASEFINYLAFDAVCNIALPCAIDSAAINLVNRCMPATKKDKYLPVD